MKIVNSVIALVLVLFSALIGLFSLGSQEQHDQAIIQHLRQTLALRITFASIVGLICAGAWWGVNFALFKSRLVKTMNLLSIARLLVASVLLGSLVGGSLYCFL
jgi:hypothetical protein